MDTINKVQSRFTKFSEEFNLLLQENIKLKAQLKFLLDENDMFKKNSQDAILTINQKLKEDIS